MKIADLRATTVSVPLEAPLRHANGTHWGRFIRTIVEVICDNGVIGLGEMGGGGAPAVAALLSLKPYLLGHDPLQLEQLPELQIRAAILNRFTAFGTPKTQLAG